MNDINFTDDKLKHMLRKATVNEPSANFTDRLAQQLPASKPATLLNTITHWQWVIIGVVALASLSGIGYGVVNILHIDVRSWFTIDLSVVSSTLNSIAQPFKELINLKNYPTYLLATGATVFALLTIDLLIRRYLFNKQQTH